MIIKHGRHIFGEIHEMRKVCVFFFNCAFRGLIGWIVKLRSHGGYTGKKERCLVIYIKAQNCYKKNIKKN